MSEKIRLTKKQLHFVTQILEISDPDKAVERFMEIMIEERVDPSDIVILIDTILKKLEK